MPFRARRSELGAAHAALSDLLAETAVVAASAGQDQAAVGSLDGQLVMVVADGAGGTSGGSEAASAVIEEVKAHLGARQVDWASLLCSVDAELAECGQTTAVVVQVVGDRIYGASVGDSEAWLFSSDSSMELTADQRPKPLIGTGRAMPVAFMANLSPGTVLVLGSDGLFKYADHQAIRGLALSSAPPSAFVDLARMASGGLQDDVAVVVCWEARGSED